MSVVARNTRLYKVTMSDTVKGQSFSFSQEYAATKEFDARVQAWTEYGHDTMGFVSKSFKVDDIQLVQYKG
ncbi:hypothetical protein PMW_38 [Pseudomonas phage phiPMW]|uniref:Uncharacterized protein n=1 Tax=Pseudomonas phage phiPMW TaxID=1815582 RepID=A0A1S5R172_9CAUD|nr:hypothetical protein FDG97_gp038 [Pseudomonas phage phiPMW]ANA49163.1 hypothetical protein PMW_38 [Pseudomonas phage phiPMW]